MQTCCIVVFIKGCLGEEVEDLKNTGVTAVMKLWSLVKRHLLIILLLGPSFTTTTYGRICFSRMHKHYNTFGFMLNLKRCNCAKMYAARCHETNALEYGCLTKGTSNFAFSLQIMNPSLCYYITITIPNLQQVPWIRKATSCSTASLPTVLLVKSLLTSLQTLRVIKHWQLAMLQTVVDIPATCWVDLC